MTRRNLFLYAVALTSMLTFAGCQTAPQPEQKRDVAADIKAINVLRDQFAAAYNSSDAAAVAAYYADDAIAMLPNQAAIKGRQAIQAMLEAYFKENAAKIAHTPLETQVAGDWAYERGNLTVNVTPKSGKPMEESIKYLVIMKRQPDGSWKLHLDIDNSNNPPPSAAGKKK
jgi:uncharacterized protein (TIGR02246 family)